MGQVAIGGIERRANGGRSGTIDSSVLQARFLSAFSACSSVIQAARWAKISRNAHYNWMREDPTYPERFIAAEKKAARTLEDEAIRRAHEGLRKAIYYKGKIVGYETEFSDSLMLAALKANLPEKYRERGSMELTGPGGGPLEVQVTFVPAPKPGEHGRTIPVQSQLIEEPKE